MLGRGGGSQKLAFAVCEARVWSAVGARETAPFPDSCYLCPLPPRVFVERLLCSGCVCCPGCGRPSGNVTSGVPLRVVRISGQWRAGFLELCTVRQRTLCDGRCPVRRSVASLAAPHQMSVATSLPSGDKQKCHQTVLGVPRRGEWGQDQPKLRPAGIGRNRSA